MGLLPSGRIFGAAAVAVVLIIGAYVAGREVPTPVAEASTESKLLAVIASRDSDSDGLPDWEESLYGTDSQTYDSKTLGMSDGEAVRQGLIVPRAIAEADVLAGTNSSRPDSGASVEGTLTAAFSRHLYSLYLTAKEKRGGAPLAQQEGDALIDEALNDLALAVGTAPDFKSASDIEVRGSGQESLRSFAAAAEAVMLFHTMQATTSETTYLSRALEGDEGAFSALESIAKGYRSTASGLAALSIPQEAAPASLALINAFMRVGEIIGDFARVNDDPLATILALSQYPGTVQSLINGFTELTNAYARAGVRFEKGEKGASFVNLLADLRETP